MFFPDAFRRSVSLINILYIPNCMCLCVFWVSRLVCWLATQHKQIHLKCIRKWLETHICKLKCWSNVLIVYTHKIVFCVVLSEYYKIISIETFSRHLSCIYLYWRSVIPSIIHSLNFPFLSSRFVSLCHCFIFLSENALLTFYLMHVPTQAYVCERRHMSFFFLQ